MTRPIDAGHPDLGLYHATLVGDATRVAAYERAIRALVSPGDVVLDLGAGTGILSVLAAKRGAARVFALESMPIAETVRVVAAANGVGEVVEVVQADARTVEPVAPVDLIVSDFMGRFVTDDCMLPAVEASLRWLKPGGRFCPREIALLLAPVALEVLDPIDLWDSPVAGLDLSPVCGVVGSRPFAVGLPADALLAEPSCYDTLIPPHVLGTWDREVSFELARGGRLVGLAGFFRAELAPGVTLETGPGHETHWYQTLFPVPPVRVEPGDRLRTHLRRQGEGAAARWCWSATLSRNGALVAEFDSEEAWPRQPLSPQVAPDQLVVSGQRAFEEGDPDVAAAFFERAVRALTPADDHWAADLYEDLGLAYIHAGRDSEAIGPFLRALDGSLTSREQSLRFLVDACFGLGKVEDGVRYLAAYETRFGSHPAGWKKRES